MLFLCKAGKEGVIMKGEVGKKKQRNIWTMGAFSGRSTGLRVDDLEVDHLKALHIHTPWSTLHTCIPPTPTV